jgi:hypothetical protein
MSWILKILRSLTRYQCFSIHSYFHGATFVWAFLVANHSYFLLLILLGSHSLITRVRVQRKLVHGER